MNGAASSYRVDVGTFNWTVPSLLSALDSDVIVDETVDPLVQLVPLNIPYTVFEILVAVLAVVGNSMVIYVFRIERKLRRRTNYYIVSLAIADLFVGLFGIPFAILAAIGLPTNLHACLFTISLLVVLCTISIFCLVAVSVDRYWAILHPMAYSRNVRTRTAIGKYTNEDGWIGEIGGDKKYRREIDMRKDVMASNQIRSGIQDELGSEIDRVSEIVEISTRAAPEDDDRWSWDTVMKELSLSLWKLVINLIAIIIIIAYQDPQFYSGQWFQCRGTK